MPGHLLIIVIPMQGLCSLSEFWVAYPYLHIRADRIAYSWVFNYDQQKMSAEVARLTIKYLIQCFELFPMRQVLSAAHSAMKVIPSTSRFMMYLINNRFVAYILFLIILSFHGLQRHSSVIHFDVMMASVWHLLAGFVMEKRTATEVKMKITVLHKLSPTVRIYYTCLEIPSRYSLCSSSSISI